MPTHGTFLDIFLVPFFSDGRLRVGDELINVNGRRLRGLEIEEAIRALRLVLFNRDFNAVSRI